jgi:hypothetical protein
MENPSNADVSQDSGNELSDLISLFLNSENSKEDTPESTLLTSLKPYLSPKRQKKIEQCEKVIMLTGTLKILKELNFFENLTSEKDDE